MVLSEEAAGECERERASPQASANDKPSHAPSQSAAQRSEPDGADGTEDGAGHVDGAEGNGGIDKDNGVAAEEDGNGADGAEDNGVAAAWRRKRRRCAQ